MSKVDADKHGVPAETRGRYTRLDDAKASYSAKNGRAMWFYNETVKLPNGDGAGALRLAALVEVPSAKGLASAPTSPGVDAFKSALVSANNECGGPPEQSKVRDHFEHLYSPAKPSKNPADAKRKAFAHVRDTLVKQGLIVMGADDRISYAPLGADLPEGDALEFEAGS